MYTTGGSPWVFTCLSLALYLRQCTDIADAFLLFMSLLIIVTIFIVAMLAYVNVIMAVCRQRRYIFDSSVLKKRSLQLNGRALCPLNVLFSLNQSAEIRVLFTRPGLAGRKVKVKELYTLQV